MEEGMQYGGGLQFEEGTILIQRRVHNVGRYEHQYKGDTLSVLTKVSNLDQSHHQYQPRCVAQNR